MTTMVVASRSLRGAREQLIRTGEEIGAVVRFADVIGGADLEPAHAVVEPILRRKHDHRQNWGEASPKLSQELHSVRVGQQHVEHE